MSFSTAFDGPQCPHFALCRKQTLGDSLSMWKEKATRMGGSDRVQERGL